MTGGLAALGRRDRLRLADARQEDGDRRAAGRSAMIWEVETDAAEPGARGRGRPGGTPGAKRTAE